jgi:hypothetical protein
MKCKRNKKIIDTQRVYPMGGGKKSDREKRPLGLKKIDIYFLFIISISSSKTDESAALHNYIFRDFYTEKIQGKVIKNYFLRNMGSLVKIGPS